jgi:hypothetical protein
MSPSTRGFFCVRLKKQSWMGWSTSGGMLPLNIRSLMSVRMGLRLVMTKDQFSYPSLVELVSGPDFCYLQLERGFIGSDSFESVLPRVLPRTHRASSSTTIILTDAGEELPRSAKKYEETKMTRMKRSCDFLSSTISGLSVVSHSRT